MKLKRLAVIAAVGGLTIPSFSHAAFAGNKNKSDSGAEARNNGRNSDSNRNTNTSGSQSGSQATATSSACVALCSVNGLPDLGGLLSGLL